MGTKNSGLVVHGVSWIRFAPAILILMALSLPWILIGARCALNSTSNDPKQWLPHGFDETDKYDQFQERFGMDEISVVSWPGCTVDDPRVEQLARALEDSKYFERALTGPRIMRQLTAPSLDVSRDEAVRRLRGTLIGTDNKTTCVVLVISHDGEADRSGAVKHIIEIAETQCGLTRESLRMGGPTVDAAEIDAESRRMLFQLAGLSALVSFVVASSRLRSLRLALIVLLGAAYATALTLAVLYYSGGTMNLLMTMLPPLVYVLTVSAAVHLVNYYRDAVREGHTSDAPLIALDHGWIPCVLASGTTAIGLISLSTSRIGPIQGFGLYASIGMVVSVLVLLVFLPCALYLLPLTSDNKKPTTASQQGDDLIGNTATSYVSFVNRNYLVMTVACLAVMIFFGVGLTRIESTVKLQHRFISSSHIINDYRWLEENLGGLVPMEVILRFERGGNLDLLERMRIVSNVEQKIGSIDGVEATMSANAFSTPKLRGGGLKQAVARTMFRKRVMDAHYLAEEEREQFWRISVRAKALGNLDYGRFTETLRSEIDPLLANLAYSVRPSRNTTGDDQSNVQIAATYTGVIPLIYKAQRELLNDLAKSFIIAFCVIAVVMIIALKSIWAGLLAMLPNLLPTIVIFGGMGWLGILVQIGSVMTASAALGIAVDDTFHFLTWFRRGSQEGMSTQAALQNALQRCAGAMILTTLTCGMGLAVFGLSSFMPILHFAWLMVTLLLAALFGDLVLLPAILASPIGRAFQHGTVADQTPAPDYGKLVSSDMK